MTGMGRWLAPGLLLLSISACWPSAAAVASAGSFRLDGPMELPADAELALPGLLAAYDGDTAVASFSLDAPTLRVRWFEYRAVHAPGLLDVQTSLEERSWTLTNASVRTIEGGDHAGFAGYAPSGAEACVFAPAAVSGVEAKALSRIPPGTEASTDDRPDLPDYWRRIAQPHLFVEAPGALTCEGPGAWKVRGFDLRIVADENTTEWRTGSERPPAQVALRWLYLEQAAGASTLASPAHAVEVAAKRADAEWTGEAWITPTRGRLTAADGSYEAAGERASLDGAFRATLAPVADAPGALDVSGLQGDLRATTLRHERAPAPLVPASWGRLGGWLPVGLVGLVTATGGAALLVVRRQRLAAQRAAHAAAYFEHYASLALDRFQPALALAWVQAGRAAGVGHADFALWEGMLHAALGDEDAALADYAEASRLDPRAGDADYWAAVLLARRGQGDDRDRALEHLEQALHRQPEFAGPVERDSVFAPLRGPDFSLMLDEAAARAGRR